METNILISLIERKLTLRQIAEAMQLSVATVRYYLNKYDLKVNSKKDAVKCVVCENPIGRKSEKYCSNTCQQEAQWQLKKVDLQEGGTGSPSTYKKLLVELEGHRCKICGTTEWMGQPVSLILDHISGNSDDNSIANLRLICPNCDHQTETFAGRNKGKGQRTYRNEMYHAKNSAGQTGRIYN